MKAPITFSKTSRWPLIASSYSLYCHTISGPSGLSIATVHGPPAIYERGQGVGFGYKWLAGLVSRVSMAGLDSRVCMAVPELHAVKNSTKIVSSP